MSEPGLRIEVQSEVGAPFVDVGSFSSAGDGFDVSIDPPQPVSAYRIVLSFPLPDGADARVHAAVFPRMIGVGSLGIGELVSEGRRSPLTASYHFDERLGAQSFGAFPAVVVLDGEKPLYLASPASELRDRASFSWSTQGSTLEVCFQFDIWGLGKRPPFLDSLRTESLYRETFSDGEIFGPHVFEGLHRKFSGIEKPSRQELFWGSWNDGHFRDIDEGRILAVADWLKSNLPNTRWIQIDDGWAGPSPSVRGTLENHAETLEMSDFGVFHNPLHLEGDSRFPDGLGGLSKKIKERGMRPMIWLTPSVIDTSPLYRDHPTWFLDRSRLHFFRELRFLDFSVPEARDYARRAFDLIFGKWGFEGCKLDYWSMGFDQHDVEIARGSASATEHLHWFASTLREYVGDGLILYGIDLPFGTPLRAKYFDQFRYYADSEGSCQSMDAMREQAMWAAFLVGLYGVQRYWVPDGDGLGLFGHFEMPENHYRLWSTFLLGSGTLTELAGWLHLKSGPRLEALKTFARHASLGDRIDLPGYSYLNANWNAPYVWVRHSTPQLVALTNWDANGRSVNVELEGDFRDVLTDEVVSFPAQVKLGSEDGRAFVKV